MSDMQQALVISGGIFAVVMASQYGRRDYSWHKVVMPLVSVAVVGYFYLRDAPTTGIDWVVYGVGALIGLAFGAIATVVTGVERDGTGRVFTRCGPAFVAVWLAAVVMRIAFIFAADHVGWFRARLGTFLFEHSIVPDAIAPFFVIMALVMVVSRIAMLRVRIGESPMGLRRRSGTVPASSAASRTDAAPVA